MADRVLPEFERFLGTPLLIEAEQQEDTVYGILPDFRLAYYNPAWVAFARANGAAEKVWSGAYLGTSVLEVTADELQPFYRKLFRLALHQSVEELRPLQHRYFCHSAEMYREFLMTLYQVGDAQGVLIVNSLVVEVEYDSTKAVTVEGREPDYVDAAGLVHQCAHCRRVHDLKTNHWDWVPDWVRDMPPRTTHTICNFCMAFFYPPAQGNGT